MKTTQQNEKTPRQLATELYRMSITAALEARALLWTKGYRPRRIAA